MTVEELKSRLSIPVIASPMFLVSGTKLVIECCKNGVAGTFPALNGRTSEQFEAMLKEITSELEKFEQQTGIKPAPFGVNIIVNKTNPRILPDLELCKKYKVPIIITSLGAVKEVVDSVHSYGGLVFHDIIKKRHAEKAAEAGVDGLICVSAGAGGHAGTASPFALVAEIKSFYSGVLLLAGSLNTGSDVLAAQTIGADFAYMGTRFIATAESLAQQEYKQMVVDSDIDDIIYTDSISGVNANFLKKSIEEHHVNTDAKVQEDFSQLNNEHAKAWKDIWSAGQGSAGIHTVPTVADLVKQLKTEYRSALDKNMKIAGHFKH
ncbi:2-nitropropane dioxygenase [Chryseobacterium sp. FH2]|uniref:NAD(P)H-dependent flavin oxidoreductase n=1 Tax=Chryseobacterium sp. FH2 TaxID=1674291 RepID=UPI00065AFBF9|nr:nitronate monooxygenase family protein [Chryseobacterium sp. FH2]KMQ65313.1 2-nitropropane dioxygenase [Chryseobacterium sp. FH2]